MIIVRALEGIDRDLSRLADQGKLEGFFNNAENANKLGGLVEEIRDAVIEYQVCIPKCSFLQCLTPEPDFITTRYL
jgi:hypothetical protein